VQVARITLRFLPVGLVAGPSVASLVTIDNGEGNQVCGVPLRGPSRLGYTGRPAR
jgi:hypothetical protein